MTTPLEDQGYKPFVDKLELGKNIIIRCSNCKLPLVDVQVTRPNKNYVNKIRANCWRCGDFSFETSIEGGIHIASTNQSLLDIIDTDGELIIITTLENKV